MIDFRTGCGPAACLLVAVLFAGGVLTVPAHGDDAKTPATAQTSAQTSTQTSAPAAKPAEDDPLEDLNRFTSSFNRVIRDAIIDPLVDGYQAITPKPVQEAIGNAAANLNEPASAISSLLQGDTENAKKSTQRFFVNTTLGLGGIKDKATEMGIEARHEDLGQAAGHHGTESGAHIVLPLLGPSNMRDIAGDVLTGVLSPLPLVGKIAQGSVQYSGSQDDIKAVTKGASDPYVVEKTAYEAHRQFLIDNGETSAQASRVKIDPADFN